MRRARFPLIFVFVLATATVCCRQEAGRDLNATRAAAESRVSAAGGKPIPGEHAYSGAGRVTRILPDGRHLKIAHGPIGDLMQGMEMSFPLGDSLEMGDLSVGDSIQFKIRTASDGYFYLQHVMRVEE